MCVCINLYNVFLPAVLRSMIWLTEEGLQFESTLMALTDLYSFASGRKHRVPHLETMRSVSRAHHAGPAFGCEMLNVITSGPQVELPGWGAQKGEIDHLTKVTEFVRLLLCEEGTASP